VQLEIDPDPELEREAEETAQRVMKGGKLDIQRMENTDVHVQRYPGEGYVDKAGKLAGDLLQRGEDKVDEATTKKYRFSKPELKGLVQSVETEAGLAEYLEHKDVDPMSSIEDSASSPLGGAMKGGKYGMKAGVLGGLPGMVAGGLAGATVGGVLAATYGKEIAGKIQHYIRDTLGLSTDQEISASETGGGNTKF